MDHLISVIVPIYKVERYLRQCVDSLLTQTYPNFELILVNDGSPDHSLDICRKYAGLDTRVRVIDKQNGGLSDARNAGIEIATGEYLCFVDSDDYVAPNYLEAMYTALRNTNADACICNFATFLDGETDIQLRKSPRAAMEGGVLTGVDILKSTFLDPWYYEIACNKLCKRELFSTLRYPVGRLFEDTHVFHHVFYHCDKVCCIADHLYYYRKRPDSITGAPFSPRRFDQALALQDRIRYYEGHNLDHLLFEPYNSYSRSISLSYARLKSCGAEVKAAWKEHKRMFNAYWARVWRCKNLNTISRYYIALVSPSLFLFLQKRTTHLQGRD